MERPEGVALIGSYAALFVVAQVTAIVIIVAATMVSEWRSLFGAMLGVRAFRCPLAGREVEVQFTERRLFGVGRPRAVRRCSAFESPTVLTASQAVLALG